MGRNSKKKAWEIVQAKDDYAFRDVHGTQQLERGSIDKPASRKFRQLLSFFIVVGLTGLGMFVSRIVLSFGKGFMNYDWSSGFSQLTPIDLMADIPLWQPLVAGLCIGLIAWGFIYQKMMLGLQSENSMTDHSDINQHHDDQHVMLTEEVERLFDWFPDVGAHSSVAPSSMISHVALSNKGLQPVDVVVRHKKTKKDAETGEIIHKGEVLRDSNGEPIIKSRPMIDEKFGQELFTASGVGLDQKDIRKPRQVHNVPYNPLGSTGERTNRDKLNYDTVADLINNDWEFPSYEMQRPGGAYIVDTAPVNTMVLAITRGGKGQTYIEPMIDMWTREKRQNNMVVNDPKGELLVKFYVPATMRGYEVVQFNLINAMKTDIYNPLGYAAMAAREGDFTQAATYVENIGDVFFPKDGADDPMWPNAANNAFKRSAFGLIDYYLEEEKQLRRDAKRHGMDPKVLAQKIDDMWGKVTLYNAYQLFVILSATKSTDESKIHLDDDDVSKEKDYLTLFFDATAKLPKNTMRTLVRNADNSLRAMAGSDKTIASVYGIALTAMSFFTDPTISALTSGKPSQNFDAQGLSFPRRMGVRFSPEYLERHRFVGAQALWSAYEDENFTKEYAPKLFHHSQLIDKTGWARYYFDGKFNGRKGYLKLEIKNPTTGLLIKTFYFEAELAYKTTLNGKSYVKDPVLNTKLIKDGVLREIKKRKDGSWSYRQTMIRRQYRDLLSEDTDMKVENVPAMSQLVINYSERPKAVFLITPPHLMSYAKLVLILVKQMVDVNFAGSYMTKENQKPLYKTRYMLDELGNLQSEGHGIPALQTMLSIGLGQEQQFTLILQTLQQLRDVYGESVDKIIQGNTNNIVFLKSTDDAMLDTLSKLSGTTHETLREGKTITKDFDRIFNKNEGRISYNINTKERPVVRFNDLLFMAERQSVVFRAGNNPIWNKNETILPMSFKLFGNTITQPGKNYSLQTVPTLSSAMYFDIKKNQPNFYAMMEKRLSQARISDMLRQRYKDVYGYEEHEMERLDEDVLSDELMDAINIAIMPSDEAAVSDEWAASGYASREEYEADMMPGELSYEEQQAIFEQRGEDSRKKGLRNTELDQEVAAAQEVSRKLDQTMYGGGLIPRRMLINEAGQLSMSLAPIVAEAYDECLTYFANDPAFRVDPSTYELRDSATQELYIRSASGSDQKDVANLREAVSDTKSRVAADAVDDVTELTRFTVTDAFIRRLSSMDSWKDICRGRFDDTMSRLYRDRYNA